MFMPGEPGQLPQPGRDQPKPTETTPQTDVICAMPDTGPQLLAGLKRQQTEATKGS